MKLGLLKVQFVLLKVKAIVNTNGQTKLPYLFNIPKSIKLQLFELLQVGCSWLVMPPGASLSSTHNKCIPYECHAALITIWHPSVSQFFFMCVAAAYFIREWVFTHKKTTVCKSSAIDIQEHWEPCRWPRKSSNAHWTPGPVSAIIAKQISKGGSI